MNWLLVGEEDGTYIWESDEPDQVYRTTEDSTPPKGKGGYFNLMALLRVRGLTHKPEAIRNGIQ